MAQYAKYKQGSPQMWKFCNAGPVTTRQKYTNEPAGVTNTVY